jgi:hypothetical protein
MHRWIITANVGPLFTEYSVTRMEASGEEVWRRAGTSKNTSEALTSDLSPQDQLQDLGLELYNEASAPPWGG